MYSETQKHTMMQERCNYDEIVMSIIKYDLCEWTTQLDWTKINKQKVAEEKPEKRNEKEQPMTATLEGQNNKQKEIESD